MNQQQVGHLMLFHRKTTCRFSDFLDEIWSEYDMQDALGEGVTTGWQGLDNLYRVRPFFQIMSCLSR